MLAAQHWGPVQNSRSILAYGCPTKSPKPRLCRPSIRKALLRVFPDVRAHIRSRRRKRLPSTLPERCPQTCPSARCERMPRVSPTSEPNAWEALQALRRLHARCPSPTMPSCRDHALPRSTNPARPDRREPCCRQEPCLRTDRQVDRDQSHRPANVWPRQPKGCPALRSSGPSELFRFRTPPQRPLEHRRPYRLSRCPRCAPQPRSQHRLFHQVPGG